MEQFETYRRALADELRAEPEPATAELAEAIRSGDLSSEQGIVERKRDGAVIDATPILLKTSSVKQKRLPAAEPWSSVFIGREWELSILEAHLKRALRGEGRIVFVKGEAGEGKTSLLRAFAGRALRVQPDVAIAGGSCNAFFGEGDPYLPFRDVLFGLTGVEPGRFVAEPGIRETDLHVNRALPLIIETFINQSPELLDIFMPSAALKKIIAVSVERADIWIEKLDAAAERSTALNRDRTQRRHFQSFTQLLHDISEEYPLLIVLDDLQWADSASIHLLFHLAQRLAGSRILLVGAYRSSEIAVARPRTGMQSGGPHPLEPVIQELVGKFGDIHIELAKLEGAEGEAFVSALVDNEPNRLGQPFRNSLFQKTNGHPLFTVELLRDIQARGDIIQDSRGRWYEKQPVDWDAMPVRVEAVIRQRVDRLEPELRRIIDVAGIAGELFSAQVVMEVLQKSEWQVVSDLSRELQTRHQLVRERGDVLVQGKPQALFQFSHPLFHEYVYRALSSAERRWLHDQVGTILEELYGEQVDEIVTELARHFELAGNPKAIDYLLQAGEASLGKFANAEAENHFRRALALNPPIATRARLQGGLAEALYRQGNKDEAIQASQRGIDDFNVIGRLEDLAWLYVSAIRNLVPYWPAEAVRFYETTLPDLDELGESIVMGHVLHQAARAYLFSWQWDKARPLCTRAVEIAERLGNLELQADTLATFGYLFRRDPASAVESFQRAAELAEASGSLYLAQRAYANLGWALKILQGRHRDALRAYSNQLELARQRGAVEEEVHALLNLFAVTVELGDLSGAVEILEDLQRLEREAPQPELMRDTLGHMRAILARRYGRWREALELVEELLTVARRVGRVEYINYLIDYHYVPIILDLHAFEKWPDWTKAASLLREVVARASAGDLGVVTIDARFLSSIVCSRQSDLDGARYWLAEARKSDVDRPNSPTSIYHLSALSELAAAEKRWDEAIDLLESIIQITTKTEQRWEQAHKLLELAEIYRRRRKSGDRDLARANYTRALELFTEMGAAGYVKVIRARMN